MNTHAPVHNLEITKITFFDTHNNSRALAVCDIVLNDVLAIHGLTIHENYQTNSLFVLMPVRKTRNTDKLVDVVHPINKQFHDYLSSRIQDAYELFEDTGERIFHYRK